MSHEGVVTSLLHDLGLLEPDGSITRLDSLNIVDLVAELELKLSITIPTELMTADWFANVAAIGALIDECRAKQ